MHLYLWNTEKLCKALVGTPIRFLITLLGLKLERDLVLLFQKIWSKLSLILFLCFLGCSFIFEVERTFVGLQFVCPVTPKLLNLVKEWEKYWKVFDHRYVFSDGGFYIKRASPKWLTNKFDWLLLANHNDWPMWWYLIDLHSTLFKFAYLLVRINI